MQTGEPSIDAGQEDRPRGQRPSVVREKIADLAEQIRSKAQVIAVAIGEDARDNNPIEYDHIGQSVAEQVLHAGIVEETSTREYENI